MIDSGRGVKIHRAETLANVRFGAQTDLKSDIAPCPLGANNRNAAAMISYSL
jgi:hypothetical protein